MYGLNALLSFLTTHASLFFFVAIAAFFASVVAQKKSPRFARNVALVSLSACAPLFVLYGLVAILRPDAYVIVLTVLWGWSTWSSWKTWRRLRVRKPVASRPRPVKPDNRWN
ncbi:MAG: hypothetical protein QY323_04835 [Patescibacteria group bacterium]|nr:MAG: hypothetical protein QY323_04835 [Patescibacteria group bacterium]